jgi:hypothetical protein
MTSVLLLSQIHAVSPQVAEELAPRVYGGTINRKDLKKALEEAKQAAHAPGGVGHERWHRTQAFEERAFTFLKENLELLGVGPDASISARAQPGILPYDFEIRSQGKAVAAVEVKAYRQKITQRVQVEALAVAALVSREFPEVLILMSKDWQRTMHAMARIRDELDLKTVRLATLDEEKAKLDPGNAVDFW